MAWKLQGMVRRRGRPVLELFLVICLVALFMQILAGGEGATAYSRDTEALAVSPAGPVGPGGILAKEAGGRGKGPGRPGGPRGRGGEGPQTQELTGGRSDSAFQVIVQATDRAGTPVEGARVEIWHADPEGNYGTCQGWWLTDAEGLAAFRTLKPGKPRAESNPHVHLRVTAKGFGQVMAAVDVVGRTSESFLSHGSVSAREGAEILEIQVPLPAADCAAPR